MTEYTDFAPPSSPQSGLTESPTVGRYQSGFRRADETAGLTGRQHEERELFYSQASSADSCDQRIVPVNRHTAKADLDRNRATKDRYLLDLKVKQAVSHAKTLAEAAKTENPIDQGICGAQLSADFQEIWKLRHLKDECWAMAVNSMQIVLSAVAFEDLELQSCEELHRCVSRYFNSGSIDAEDLANMNSGLMKVGLNPFSVFS